MELNMGTAWLSHREASLEVSDNVAEQDMIMRGTGPGFEAASGQLLLSWKPPKLRMDVRNGSGCLRRAGI